MSIWDQIGKKHGASPIDKDKSFAEKLHEAVMKPADEWARIMNSPLPPEDSTPAKALEIVQEIKVVGEFANLSGLPMAELEARMTLPFDGPVHNIQGTITGRIIVNGYPELDISSKAPDQISLVLTAEGIESYCSACENSGWECYSVGMGDPHFRVCTLCGNPEGLPCP